MAAAKKTNDAVNDQNMRFYVQVQDTPKEAQKLQQRPILRHGYQPYVADQDAHADVRPCWLRLVD